MKILITGSEGFIGSVAKKYFRQKGYDVYGLDNLSRCFHPEKIDTKNLIIGDIRDLDIFQKIPKVDVIIHLAAQVSVVDGDLYPELDFNVNAKGTFNVVQWAKKNNTRIIYASTNKVFGDLKGVYKPITDDQKLEPKTNYGVSKCAGAIYVNDFGGHVLHQSCIYGETQLGDENQGWVGWLRQCRRKSIPITCYGDGSQIRDLLHVNDLVRLYDKCVTNSIPHGQYIVGGGVENAYSFSQVVSMLGSSISKYDKWRKHDQKYFISDNTKLKENNYWKPEILFDQFIKTEINS